MPGENWREAIENSIRSAKAAILLLSPDYMASKFSTEVELPVILKRSSEEGMHLFPIIVSPLSLNEPLSSYQTVNSPSKPLTSLSNAEQRKVFIKLSDSIKSLLSKGDESKEIVYNEVVEDKYSKALRQAVSNIAGTRHGGINIFGDANIFFEAEKKIAKKNG